MRSRVTLLFLLLVGAPLALLAWVGTMLVRQESAQARETWLATLEERLGVVETLMSQEIRRLEDAFDTLLRETDLSDATLRAMPREQPLIRTAFLLDAEGRLRWPAIEPDTTQGEAIAFMRRTAPVWESGVRFGQPANDAEVEGQGRPSSGSRGATFLKKSEGRASVKLQTQKGMSAPAVKASGWHVWFYGNGPQLLFWQERGDGRVVGVEVEMAALLSLLINRLSSEDSPHVAGLLRLTSADGKTLLHQWGAADANAVSPAVVQRPGPAPLSMWQIAYFPAHNEGPQSRPGPVLLGTGLAAVTLVGLAWLFYRESQRETREARRRVSFVNQVSHELKTPLTNIRLYAEMAQQQLENEDPSAAYRHLAVVEAETSRLSRLIHNVLTFARQQRDELGVNPREASLDDVAQRSLALWRPGLEARDFKVVSDLNAPMPFSFDPDAVEQILGNLLSNVEKYAASGHHVRVATEQADGKGCLTVEDQGPGIPARQQQDVFLPFVRLRGDLTEGVSGTGIGLSISRHLARLQGGTLEVESRPQGGARFVLKLPLRKDAPAKPAEPSRP